MVNAQPDLMLVEQPLQELQSESTKPVSICDHNFCDSSLVASFQNGEQTGPLPVETGGDVADELVLRIRFLEVPDLSLEVFLLVLRRDAGVDDFGALWRSCGGGCVGTLDELEELLLVVETLAARQLEAFDASGLGPSAERRGVNTNHLSKLSWCDISRICGHSRTDASH